MAVPANNLGGVKVCVLWRGFVMEKLHFSWSRSCGNPSILQKNLNRLEEPKVEAKLAEPVLFRGDATDV